MATSARTAGPAPAPPPPGGTLRCTCRSGATVWLTGPPGPRKAALARAVRDELRGRGRRVEVLYGDEPPHPPLAGPAPHTADADRLRIGLAAETLARNDVTVLALAPGPHPHDADPVRARHHAADVPYLEVQVGRGTARTAGSAAHVDVTGQDTPAAAAALLHLMTERGLV
ncbi:adenylyl-sulfate kinase [Kitasatospora sp. NBC_01539]|uniref:adenylyl-sulfate kinase n=1 Tax=Kitasatospora sp. NBC_01539 TaxID=2903577 RepID=UPI00386028C8